MNALSFLSSLGTPAEVQAAAKKLSTPGPRRKVNVHVHLPPNFSAFQNVEQLISLAARENIGVLGASNYYFYDVYEKFSELALAHGIFPLFGTEIISTIDSLTAAGIRVNDPGNPGRMYLCGKGVTRFTNLSPRATELIQIIRNNDRRRMAAMIDKMAAIFRERAFDTALTEAAVIRMVTDRHTCDAKTVILQERHIAQAFQETIFTNIPIEKRVDIISKALSVPYTGKPDDHVKVQNEIRSHLMKAGKPAFVVEEFLSFEQARDLILELGGIPCYPTLADGASKLCEFEATVEILIKELQTRGLAMAEFIPLRNKPEVLDTYVRAMRKAGIVVVAGTEHNSLDLIPIEPFCVGNAPISEELRQIFWEGACVLAAHQFLLANGQEGFVSPKTPVTESRIKEFAAIGATVLQKFETSRKNN